MMVLALRRIRAQIASIKAADAAERDEFVKGSGGERSLPARRKSVQPDGVLDGNLGGGLADIGGRQRVQWLSY